MSETKGHLFLSDEALADLGISTDAMICSIERALGEQAAGRLWTAPKSALLPGDGRYMMATLSTGNEPSLTVVKAVTVSPDNPHRGLSGINGAIMLFDGETGLLCGVMGANWVTAVRTAALSAVAAKRLANPQSTSVAFVGCGVQARSHLDAFSQLFPIEEIRAFGRGQANLDRLCAAAEAKGLRARRSASAREALEGADLVVTSITLSYDTQPFLDAGWLKPGAFAAITDLALPWLPDSMSAFDTVVIDDRQQEATSDKPMVDPDLVRGDLTELATGQVELGFAAKARSAFVFRGIALGDFAVAALAYERAKALGRGVRVT